jgi:hypothetical protein
MLSQPCSKKNAEYKLAKYTPMSRLTFSFFTILSVVLLLCPTACGPDKEQIVAEKIAERVSDFRKKESMKCRAALLRDAESIVDSLLLEEARAALGDSLAALRPFKPPKPALIPAIDSLSIAPIFKTASSTRGNK